MFNSILNISVIKVCDLLGVFLKYIVSVSELKCNTKTIEIDHDAPGTNDTK